MTPYYLWVVPAGAFHDQLVEIINRLSQQYRGPQFAPHITLLGAIEGEESIICEQTSALARSLKPLELQIGGPAYQQEYFRCLYLAVEETAEILEAHQQARRIFTNVSEAPFHPHLSLLYGFFPSRVKQDIINALPPELPQTFSAYELQLIRADSTHPKDWHAIQTFQL